MTEPSFADRRSLLLYTRDEAAAYLGLPVDTTVALARAGLAMLPPQHKYKFSDGFTFFDLVTASTGRGVLDALGGDLHNAKVVWSAMCATASHAGWPTPGAVRFLADRGASALEDYWGDSPPRFAGQVLQRPSRPLSKPTFAAPIAAALASTEYDDMGYATGVLLPFGDRPLARVRYGVNCSRPMFANAAAPVWAVYESLLAGGCDRLEEVADDYGVPVVDLRELVRLLPPEPNVVLLGGSRADNSEDLAPVQARRIDTASGYRITR